MKYECHSRVRDYESGDLGPIVVESRRTDPKAAHQDAELLRMFGKRAHVEEVDERTSTRH
jgi:hypothetical protein